MLHLYGRYCNANKLAGEVDLFEALDDVKRHYPIDENRILVRGFSMGGAAAWHFGAHYAGLWAAVAPGAGFSETADFLKSEARSGPMRRRWWEEKLWHLYDATDYAVNFFNCREVAYNGEIDPQKQAADMMEKAMAAEGMRLIRVVGPKTPHRYHPDSKIEIDRMHRCHRRARARSVSAQGALHHLDARLQPDEVGDRGCAGQALGAGAAGCGDRRRPRRRASRRRT